MKTHTSLRLHWANVAIIDDMVFKVGLQNDGIVQALDEIELERRQTADMGRLC